MLRALILTQHRILLLFSHTSSVPSQLGTKSFHENAHDRTKGYSQAPDYKFQAYVEDLKIQHDDEGDPFAAPH